LGRTPLHYAAAYGDLKALKILICARANVNSKSIVKFILELYIIILFSNISQLNFNKNS